MKRDLVCAASFSSGEMHFLTEKERRELALKQSKERHDVNLLLRFYAVANERAR